MKIEIKLMHDSSYTYSFDALISLIIKDIILYVAIRRFTTSSTDQVLQSNSYADPVSVFCIVSKSRI